MEQSTIDVSGGRTRAEFKISVGRRVGLHPTETHRKCLPQQ